MPIDENLVSVLIPTYQYADLITETVRSALNTNAGEVIVLDDASRDDTLDKLKIFKDRRLQVHQQRRNVGLWRNHRDAISYATRPWIKFLQADDRLLPGALGRMVAEINAHTTIIWSNPIFRDLETGNQWLRYRLDGTLALTSTETFNLIKQIGFFLGTPSHMLVRRDTIDLSDAAWSNDVSADVILGSRAIQLGQVVLLPAGNIVQGVHARQDAATQGIARALTRLLNTLLYLELQSEQEAKLFSAQYAAVEAIGFARSLLGQLRRLRSPGIRKPQEMFSLLRLVARQRQYMSYEPILRNLRVKFSKDLVDIRLKHLPR